MVSCQHFDVNKIPKVTFGGVDVRNNQVTQEKVLKYNDKTCKVETQTVQPLQLILEDGTVNPKLHGYVMLSYQDFINLYGFCEGECKKNLNNQIKKLIKDNEK
jgi:hypothetical protein